jgi:hypothetical protein
MRKFGTTACANDTHGEAIGALVDAGEFARIRRMRDRFDALSNRIAEGFADIPADEGVAQIDALMADERKRS